MRNILCVLAIVVLLFLSLMTGTVAAGFATGQVSASTSATFGLDSGTGTYSHAGNLLNVMKFSNTAGDGNLIKLEVLFNGTAPNGKVRMGVYSDNGGVPGTLLLDAGETTVANGWVSITGLNMPVYKNTYYWLAFDMQSLNYVKYQPGQPSGGHCWNTFTYGPLPTKFNFYSLYTNSSPYVMRATVTLGNIPPVAVNDSYGTSKNTALTVAASGVLTNDTDANGDSLTAVLVSSPSNGAVTLNSNGSFTYTPTTGYSGSDSFTYKSNDGQADSNTATVSITITNTPPVAVDDSYNTPKNTTLTIAATGVLTDDTDANGDSLTAALVTSPSHGTVTLNTDGSFTYTPTTGYSGTDSFIYKANDGQADSNTATVSITITNTPPVAVNDSYSTPKNTTLTIAEAGVLTNDTDADGDSLIAVLATRPAKGTLMLDSNGSFTYTPFTGYTGSDSFTYKANDGQANSNTATVSITITVPVNIPPVAVNDSYSTPKNTTLTVAAASGVLANDTDVDGDSLTAVLVTSPTQGTLTFNSDGSFTYTPSTGYTGSDSFTYKANDGQADSNIATVSITITVPVNIPPVAVNDSYSTLKNTTLTVAAASGLLANDTDANSDVLTAILISGPANGSLTLNNDGSFIYTPLSGFVGTDIFIYKANDGQADSNIALVSITITVPVNIPPVAVNDSYITPKNTTLTVAAASGVLANDTDADGDSLTAVLVTSPVQGTLTFNSNGSFIYTPFTGYTGSDSFTYKANDGQADSNTATVSITITTSNTPPVAVNDSYSTPKNTTLTVAAASGVLANDTDVDGDSLTAVLVTSPAQGTLTFNSDGSFTYTPSTGYTGSDSFTYKANDGQADSNIATVSITITVLVNIPPVAVNDSYSTLKNTTLTVAAASGVLANDTDTNSDVLTAILISGPANGSLTLNNDGSFIYTPLSGFVGIDIFIYKANDGKADSNIALVSITVTDLNHPPVAVNDNYTTTENTMLSVTPGVLSNDTDADGDKLTAILISGMSYGTLTLNSNGSFSYTPSSGYIGTDSFTYKANDGQANSNLATVTISIIAPTSPATFGLNSGQRVYNHSGNILDAMRFKNTAGSGNLTRLEILFNDSTPNGKVRLGVYSDNGGVPGTLLLDAGEVTVTNGWVAISGLDLPVSAGTYYWLAFNMNSQNIIAYETGQPSLFHYWTTFAYGPLPAQFELNGAVSNFSPYVMRATVYIN